MNTTLSIAAWPAHGRTLFSGVLACAVVAIAATLLSQHGGAPVMLFTLLLSRAMNFLSNDRPWRRWAASGAARNMPRSRCALIPTNATSSARQSARTEAP